MLAALEDKPPAVKYAAIAAAIYFFIRKLIKKGKDKYQNSNKFNCYKD